MTKADPVVARGRPRDPHMEARVFEAALDVYAQRGWSGFTLDAVARTAGVGNAAIYRRWDSKAALLSQAVQAYALTLEDIDTGSTREDLMELGRHFLLGYQVPAGIAGLRMVLDARANPDLATAFEAERDGPRRVSALSVLKRAAARGDLNRAFTPGMALEVLAGTTLVRLMYRPTAAQPGQPRTTADDERFLGRLVDGLLAPDVQLG